MREVASKTVKDPVAIQPLVAYYCRIINERGIGWCIGRPGIGTPEFDVTHSGGGPCAFVAIQPGGNVGGVTSSKFMPNSTGCIQRKHCGGPGAGTAAEDIDSAPAIDIVWRSGCAALGGTNMNCRIIQRRSARVDVVAESGRAHQNNAMAPAICGVAMDVPLRLT